MTDDIAAIAKYNDSSYEIYPGLPHIKLWKDVLIHLNQSLHLEKVRPQLEKYRKPIEAQNRSNPNLSKLVVLTFSNESAYSHSEILGFEKFHALRNNTYRVQFIDKLNQTKAHYQKLSKLVNSVVMYRADRPHSPLKVKEFAK